MTTAYAPDRPALPTPTSTNHPFIDHPIIRPDDHPKVEEAVITATLCPAALSAFEPAPQPATDGTDILLSDAPATAELLPCRVQDADLWFAETPAELEQAKGFCADCPVRVACLSGAMARHEPWGVWGGEIFERGAIVARKRPRGRPRKDAVAA